MDNKGHHVKNEKMCAREVGNNFQKSAIGVVYVPIKKGNLILCHVMGRLGNLHFFFSF